MNVFGRTPESLKAIIRLFQADLADYPIGAVELAFTSWRRDNTAFPTPFDILNILRYDPDESVEDPIGFQGWYVKRRDLKPGDLGYIKPPALAGEIAALLKSPPRPQIGDSTAVGGRLLSHTRPEEAQRPSGANLEGRMVGDIASGIIRRLGDSLSRDENG